MDSNHHLKVCKCKSLTADLHALACNVVHFNQYSEKLQSNCGPCGYVCTLNVPFKTVVVSSCASPWCFEFSFLVSQRFTHPPISAKHGRKYVFYYYALQWMLKQCILNNRHTIYYTKSILVGNGLFKKKHIFYTVNLSLLFFFAICEWIVWKRLHFNIYFSESIGM